MEDALEPAQTGKGHAPEVGVAVLVLAALLVLCPPWPMLERADSVFCAGVEIAPMFDPRGWKFEFPFGAGPVPRSLIG